MTLAILDSVLDSHSVSTPNLSAQTVSNVAPLALHSSGHEVLGLTGRPGHSGLDMILLVLFLVSSIIFSHRQIVVL